MEPPLRSFGHRYHATDAPRHPGHMLDLARQLANIRREQQRTRLETQGASNALPTPGRLCGSLEKLLSGLSP